MSVRKIVIKNGRIIDPANDVDQVRDLTIEDGWIVENRPDSDDFRIIDASGKWIVPGLIDMHTHLRDPGQEYKETIRTGTLAAAAGGFTSIACMPNTDPVNDTSSVTEYILKKASKEGVVNVYPVSAITQGLSGKNISEMAELKEAGAVAFSDDGRGVTSAEVMRRAMEYSSMLDMPVISHCEDAALSVDGVMNEGFVSTELGLKGIPNAAEEVMAARDIILASLTGTRLHIAHISSAGTVRLVRNAKKQGIKVTCETAPHYFTLTDETVRGFDTNAKMNPPLRIREDVDSIIEALRDGTIDVIATDHAPHEASEKEVEFCEAPFGILGLETSLPITLDLFKKGILTATEVVKKMSVNPASIIGINRGRLSVGDVADITVIDPTYTWKVDSVKFRSLSSNSPFHGWKMTGAAFLTMVSGKIVYRLNE